MIPSPNLLDAPSSSLLSAPAPAMAAKPQMREFGDVDATRKAIYDQVFQAASTLAPVTNQRYTMRLHSLKYLDPETFSLRDQKQAILSGRTLGRRLRGTWDLVDNATGQPVDSRQQVVATVPFLSHRGTYINSGNEYTLRNQQRLRAGIFSREKDNGEIEAHANVLPGKGMSHRYHLDPAKGVYYLDVQQAKLPLLPLLSAMGATPQQLREAWGPEIYAANLEKDEGAALKKLAAKVLKPGELSDDLTTRQKLVEKFQQMELDPEVTRRTLGQPRKALDLDTILAVTRKLLALSRKEAEVDDRDALQYQNFLGPEDLFAERIGKDSGGLRRALLFQATNKGNLASVPSSALKPQIEQALLGSGLGQALEEINPLEIFDKLYSISRLGEGGIASTDAVPDEARNVQPSHFGYVDPLRTPESFRVGVDLYMSHASRKGTDGKIYTQFKDPRTGQMLWKTPQEVADAIVTFPKALSRPGSHVVALQNGRMTRVRKKDVNLVMDNFNQAFSPLGNMVPLKNMVKGQRVAMASRMLTQALPLAEAEAPLVQSALPGSRGERSFEDEYGARMGAARASQAGQVLSVSPDAIKVRYADGKEDEIELYNNFPFNRKSVTGDTVILIRRAGRIFRTAIADYGWEAKDEVLSIDPFNKNRSAWMEVTGFTKHRNDKRLFRVCTASGRHVDVTEDHSLVTLGDNGKLTPVYPLDCVVGRTRFPLAFIPQPEALEPSDRTAREALRDRGRLAGLYLSEGHIPPAQPNLLTIAVEPDDRAEQVMQLLRRVSKSGHEPYRNGGTVCVTDDALSAWLREMFGEYAHGKCIPAEVLNEPVVFRSGLIEGYLGGDGCLWDDGNGAIQVTAVSVSQALRDGMVDVLASLGIFATLWDAPRAHLNSNWRDGYGLRIITRHLNHERRWFFYDDRQALFEELHDGTTRSSPFEAIPVPRGARRLLYAGFDGPVPRFVYKTASLGYVAKHRVVDCAMVYGIWGRSDVLWDLLESVTPIAMQEHVYDLEVRGSENFAVCHGLIVHNTFLHQTPTVKPGDSFTPGQLLARSNYTDKSGTTALGRNARVAYVSWGGKNFEDAVVVSEGFAKKMASEHMYQHELEKDEQTKLGKKAYVSLFPGRFDRKLLDKLGADGIIKPGTVVEYGDPLILAAQQRADMANKVHRRKQAGHNDASITWEHHDPGVVTDVAEGKDGPVVVVKSLASLQVGDKLSGRYGDKGVIASIIPDHQMPQDQQGQPFELLLNPLGIISRTNPAQMVELALGKLAAKLGRPIKVEDFDEDKDMTEWALGQLRQHGLDDLEDVVDPTKDRKIRGVATGMRFFMKLHHTSESKGQARGSGAYTSEGQPAKGGASGSKRVALLDANALLSHGATETMRDNIAVRGQNNEDYWLQYLQGYTPRVTKVPMVYDKFIAHLQAGGINVVRQGSQTHIMALTDKDLDHLAGDRNLVNGDAVDAGGKLKPIVGGLFDKQLTGGHNGRRWAALPLAEPMPNPVMEEPIRRVLGLTKKGFEDVLSGTKTVRDYGTGPQAIAKALAAIDLPRELERTRTLVQMGNKTERDEAIRKLGYLKSAERLGIHPQDWILRRAPVLPPVFRPISMMRGGMPLVSDPNYLYKDLFEANENLKTMQRELGVEGSGPERLALYHAFKAVTGLGDPVSQKAQQKGVRGVLRTVFGQSPKFGMVQRKLISTTVDNVGRAVIVPNPDLDMDSVGLPEEKAYDVYGKFVARRLRRQGMPLTTAMHHIKEHTETAKRALLEEMEQRPVYINRAPVLHKFGILAFYPRLVKGDAMQVSPLIVKGFNADFDGDAMQFHVPGEEGARKEAIERLLPSRSLLSPADFRTPVHMPTNEYMGGIFTATDKSRSSQRPAKFFRTMSDFRQAFARGDVGLHDQVTILEK